MQEYCTVLLWLLYHLYALFILDIVLPTLKTSSAIYACLLILLKIVVHSSCDVCSTVGGGLEKCAREFQYHAAVHHLNASLNIVFIPNENNCFAKVS